MPSLAELQQRGDYCALIDDVQARVAADRRALVLPELKRWCARRFRNLLITEAERDVVALDAATGARDDARPPRKRLAERFLKHCGVDEWQTEMPAARSRPLRNTTLLFCPGLLNGLLPIGAFQSAMPEVERKLGIRVLRADSHPVRGCEPNVADLRASLERGLGQAANLEPFSEPTAIAPGDVMLVCYSKGAPDALTLLARHPELARRVRCVFLWAGAVGGSFIANDVYGAINDVHMPLGRIADPVRQILKIIAPVVELEGAIRRMDEYDVRGALQSLTTGAREAFLEEHSALLDALSIPFFNLTGATSLFEVPYFQASGVIALNRVDTDNDMQLVQKQAKLALPMATDLAVLHAHHWDLAYDPFPKNRCMGSSNLEHPFPKKAALTAMVQLAAELGLID